MFSARLIFAYVILYVVLTKLALFAAHYFSINYVFPATIYIITTVAIAISAAGLTFLIARKFSWLEYVNTSKITDESLQHLLLQMLISLFLFGAGTTASVWWKEVPGLFFPALAVAIIGAVWLYKSALLYLTFMVAAQKNPALLDERSLNNQRDSEKWAFVGCLEMALLLGYLDFIGLAAISGATVGFSVAIFGVVVALMRQYWLEKQDG